MMIIFVQSADFFRADNPEGMEARNEVNIYQNLLLWVYPASMSFFSILLVAYVDEVNEYGGEG